MFRKNVEFPRDQIREDKRKLRFANNSELTVV